MREHTFIELRRALQRTSKLHISRGVLADEKLVMFLRVLTGPTCRSVGDRWQHSESTVSSAVTEVATAVEAMLPEYMQPPTSEVPTKIAGSSRYYPYFKDCVGALDGT